MVRLWTSIHEVTFVYGGTRASRPLAVHAHAVVHDTTRFGHAMVDRGVYVVSFIEYWIKSLTQDKACSGECFPGVSGLYTWWYCWSSNQFFWWNLWSNSDPYSRMESDRIGKSRETDRLWNRAWAPFQNAIRSRFKAARLMFRIVGLPWNLTPSVAIQPKACQSSKRSDDSNYQSRGSTFIHVPQ